MFLLSCMRCLRWEPRGPTARIVSCMFRPHLHLRDSPDVALAHSLFYVPWPAGYQLAHLHATIAESERLSPNASWYTPIQAQEWARVTSEQAALSARSASGVGGGWDERIERVAETLEAWCRAAWASLCGCSRHSSVD